MLYSATHYAAQGSILFIVIQSPNPVEIQKGSQSGGDKGSRTFQTGKSCRHALAPARACPRFPGGIPLRRTQTGCGRRRSWRWRACSRS
ncbi:MAG: hypothetical protein MZV64_00495 [Ignavibacteriales bacterium]|nr:hypothetical protein [Ignavibacteriales bacterium]